MPIDDLTWRVHGRVQEYLRSRRGEVILDPEVSADAAALWRSVRAFDRATAPPVLRERMLTASAVLGWLYYLRHGVLDRDQGTPPGGRAHAELARAVVCLEPSADDPDALPSALTSVLGPDADPDAQAGLALTLLTASGSDDDPALLDAGILLMEPAVAALPERDPDRSSRLSNLCLAYRRRHERSGSETDLDLAVAAGEEALAIASECGADVGRPRTLLAFAHWSRYRLGWEPADLRRVIELLEQALDEAAPGPDLLSDLGMAYRQWHEHNGEPAALDRAVACGERAAALSGGGDIAVWSNLSGSLMRRYERDGRRADLWRAAELAERVLAALPDDHPDRGPHLADAAVVLLMRHEHGRALDDLHRAVELGERALEIMPDDHPHRPGALANLADALRQRHLSTGAAADLDRAVELGRWALAATADGHPDRVKTTAALAASHLVRYGHTGLLSDLETAIELGEQAVASASGGSAEWPSLLGSAYQQRYSGTGAAADLDRAIDLGERSLASADGGPLVLARRRARLAIAYCRRYEHVDAAADLDRAIELGELAVADTPDGHLDRAGWSSNLSTAYLHRSRLGRASDLERAAELGEQALAASRADSPHRVRLVANLCAVHLDQVVGEGRRMPPERLRELVREVSGATAAPPVDRVWGHHAIGALAQATGQGRLAVAALDTAVALLPSVTSRAAKWADQQHRLGEHLGLAGAAVAAHCAVGDPAGAVEAAELGRGVLLAGQADARTDLGELEERAPDLADRLHRVRARLNAPACPPAERRRRWAEHDALLSRIRTLPGLAHFLTPPRLADLRPAAAGGFVVLVNAGRHRGDAVVVRADADPLPVRLPDLHLAEVEARVGELLRAMGDQAPLSGALRRRQVVREILGWLWDCVVAPVLDALPAAGPSPHRVWWLPTGFLGLLPLHAAGRPGRPGALDALVSSYIPTLRALRDARDRPAARTRRRLTVALHRTPGLPDLPGVAAEAAALHGPALVDEQATTGRVLAALPEATWVHFACHASADPAMPTVGGLRLHDGVLRLPRIGGLRLHGAELAYLSACSTAHHGRRHADEALHLASAFQLAGFRHVVASLWPLSDGVAAEAARSFYREMPDTPAADGAAAVLHRVTRGLRDAHPDRPDLWAPLIHSGP